MVNSNIENYLAYKIIKISERSTKYWKKESGSNHEIMIQQGDYKKNNSRKSAVLAEAEKYEHLGYIKCKWVNGRNDLEQIKYSDINKDVFYEIIGRVPKYQRIVEYTEEVSDKLKRSSKGWIRAYYESLLSQLDEGKIPKEFERQLSPNQFPSDDEIEHAFMRHHDYDLMFLCLNGLDELEEPIYKKLFSSNVFTDSKVFENSLQDKIVSLVRTYGKEDGSIELDENMSAQDILPQILIEEYGATLNIKGRLKIILNEKKIDLGDMIYGCELNSNTLKYAEICKDQSIKKIITVENKANFVSMPYEEGTLLIFSHGYPSPLERRFLSNLYHILDEKSVEYYHTGDLDYGGISIFRYIRTRIFPELKPYQMNREIYLMYKDNWGKPLGKDEKETKEKCEKLQKIKEPLLQDLIDEMVIHGIGIEQECFLIE